MIYLVVRILILWFYNLNYDGSLIIILIGFVLAISLARIIIPNIIIISRRKGLFDLPDGRKVHRRPISRLGGVCFFPTILFAVTFLVALCKKAGWFFWMDGTTQFPELLLLCSGLTLLFIVGIADDLVGVRWRQKFLVQILRQLCSHWQVYM